MKPLKTNRAALITLGSILFCQTAGAAEIVKANNNTALNNNGAWVGNVQPGASDIAVWNNVVTATTANGSIFNANGTPVWGQVKIADPGGDIFISDSGNHQLQLNGVSGTGLDMSAATVDLYIGATTVLNSAQQFNVAANRTVTFFSSITNPGNLTFTGAGNLATGNNITLSTAQPFTGKTRVQGGTLTLSGSGQLTATSLVEVTGGTLVLGSATGAADRINPAAILSMGGTNGPGTFTLTAGSPVVNSQTFGGLIADKGFSSINNTNGATALTFNGTHTRRAGGFINFGANTANFAVAPTGTGVVGSGGNEILRGVTLADVDFVKAAAGVISAATYTDDLFGTGLNSNLTTTATFGPDLTTQSLRLKASGNPVFTLSGSNTIESGMIAVSDAGTTSLTGGSIHPAAGRNLVVYTSNARNMVLNSVVSDGTEAAGFERFGGGTINLGGDNTFTGSVYLQGGFTELRHANALGSPTATAALNVVGGTTLRSGTGVTNVTISRPIILSTGQGLTYDTNGAANTVTITGTLQGTPFARANITLGGTSTLTKAGEGVLNFTGSTITNVTNQNLGINVTGGTLNISGNYTGVPGAYTINGRNMATSPAGSTVPTINILSGGTLYNNKDWNVGSGTSNSVDINMAENSSVTSGRLYVGKGIGAVVNFNQNGGTHTAGIIGFNSDNYGTDFHGTYNLNGGTLTSSNASPTSLIGVGGVFNLNGGLWKLPGNGVINPVSATSLGKIYVGAGGAKLEATGAASTNFMVNVALEHNPNVTGIDGGFTKTGPGTLILTGSWDPSHADTTGRGSTYNGVTRVQAGILAVGQGTYGTTTTYGSLGTGDVSVEGGLLDLQVSKAIGDTATLRFKSVGSPNIALSSTVEPEVLATIVDTDDLTKKLPAGTYTAAQLNTFFGKEVFAGDGSVTVSAPPVTTDGYADWATANGLTSANNGKAADPDNDGISNLMEYATGGNPLNGSSRGVEVAKVQNVSGTPALTLTASIRTGVTFAADPSGAMVGTFEGNTYRVEASTDLVNWNKTVSEITPAISGDTTTTAPTGTTYHSFRTTDPVSTTSKEFIRLRVTAP